MSRTWRTSIHTGEAPGNEIFNRQSRLPSHYEIGKDFAHCRGKEHALLPASGREVDVVPLGDFAENREGVGCLGPEAGRLLQYTSLSHGWKDTCRSIKKTISSLRSGRKIESGLFFRSRSPELAVRLLHHCAGTRDVVFQWRTQPFEPDDLSLERRDRNVEAGPLPDPT